MNRSTPNASTLEPQTPRIEPTSHDCDSGACPPLPRLTPDLVLSAYRATGLRPAYGIFEDVERMAGCGLTVVCVAHGLPWPGPYYSIISRWLDLPVEYVMAFAQGWDGIELTRAGLHQRRQGYADGVRCRLAVRGYGVKEAA